MLADAHVLDYLARRHTAAPSLADLLAPGGTYRPSLYPPPYSSPRVVEEIRELADGYDAAQAAAEDPRRAYRGSPEWWTPYAGPVPIEERRPRRPARRRRQATLPGVMTSQRAACSAQKET